MYHKQSARHKDGLVITRRSFVIALGAGTCTPFSSFGQQPAKPPLVGYLHPGFPPPSPSNITEEFRQGLRDNGYVEGRNITVEYRWGRTQAETLPALAMELVKLKSGVEATHAAYKGCAPGLTDVVGGQIPLAILSANLGATHVKSGKLRGIGVSAAARYKLMPDVPTFEEQGLKPLDFSIWYALMGPARMPPNVVGRIFADVQKVLENPDVRARLSNAGVEPLNGTAADLAKLIKEDLLRYQQLAKSANIKAE